MQRNCKISSKNTFRIKSIFIFIGLISLMMINHAHAKSPQPPKPIPSENINSTENNSEEKQTFLFVQTAAEGIIQHDKINGKKLTVVLKNINPYVTYFTNRPNRKSGQIPIEKFLGLWKEKGKNNFKQDAPNADVHAVRMGAKTSDNKLLNFVLVLINPQYDKANNTLTYTVQPVEGSPTPLMKSTPFKQVTVFIDDACLSCF